MSTMDDEQLLGEIDRFDRLLADAPGGLRQTTALVAEIGRFVNEYLHDEADEILAEEAQAFDAKRLKTALAKRALMRISNHYKEHGHLLSEEIREIRAGSRTLGEWLDHVSSDALHQAATPPRREVARILCQMAAATVTVSAASGSPSWTRLRELIQAESKFLANPYSVSDEIRQWKRVWTLEPFAELMRRLREPQAQGYTAAIGWVSDDYSAEDLRVLARRWMTRLRLRIVERHDRGRRMRRMAIFLERFERRALRARLDHLKDNRNHQYEAEIQRTIDDWLYRDGLLPFTHVSLEGGGNTDTFAQECESRATLLRASPAPPLLIELKQVVYQNRTVAGLGTVVQRAWQQLNNYARRMEWAKPLDKWVVLVHGESRSLSPDELDLPRDRKRRTILISCSKALAAPSQAKGDAS